MTLENNNYVHDTAFIDEKIASVTKEIADAAEQIKRLEEKRRRLWTQRNDTQPISFLPSEILLNVFNILRYPSYECATSRSRSQLWDWVTITKVCRSWRESAINSSTLWTNLSQVYDIDRAQAFLERSKNADVDIFYETRLPRSESGVRLLLQGIMVRVRILHFKNIIHRYGNDSVEDWIANPGPMPRLIELCVDVSETRKANLLQNWNIVASKLEMLELVKFGTPWSHPMFDGLKVLILSRISFGGPTVKELQDILKNCRSIRKLRLDNVKLRVISDDHQSKLQPVHLPHLRAFDLLCQDNSDRDGYLGLLESLRLNINNNTMFHFNFGSDSGGAYSTYHSLIFSPIPNHLGHLISDFDARGELVIIISPISVCFELYKDSDVRRDGGSPVMKLDIGVTFSMSVKGSVKVLLQQEFIKNAPNPCLQFRLKCAYYQDPIKFTKSLWVDVFEAISSLKRIEIHCGRSKDENFKFLEKFVSAITLRPEQKLIGLNAEYHCVNLEEISLVGFRFSVAYEKVFQDLLNHLKFRGDTGKRLQKLRLSSCEGAGILDRIRPRLSEIVDELLFE